MGSAREPVPVEIHVELDSTNAEARRRAEAGEFGPTWILALDQTAGRGRRGRAWDSGWDNLTATYLFTLAKPPTEAAQLAFVTGLAVFDLVETYVPTALVGLKWPNDVLIEGMKVSGMLIESGPAEGRGLWLAVGVGVNLVDFPKDVERPATAISQHLRPAVSVAPKPIEAIGRLSRAFSEWFEIWLADGFEPIRQAWTGRAVGMGQPCTVRLERESVTGIAEGLDADGALLLRLPGGMLRRITAGDVFFGEP